MEIVTRFFQASAQNYFLFGPRGTGKSTMVRSAYTPSFVIDLLQPDLYRQFKAKPERITDHILAHKGCKTIVIDEVQRVPEILTVIHQLIEKKFGLQFILTGSSARKLKRTGIDLLGGRAQKKNLHPFMAAEISNIFNLNDSLQFGTLPLIVSSTDPANDLKAYIALYMQEEVQMEGLIRKTDEFSHFLEVISFSQASTINLSNISRECGVSNKTIENYVQILEDLLLCFKISVFTKKAQRNLSQHNKFYYFDVGVYQSIRPQGPMDNIPAISGHALETLVAQHLRAWLDYSDKNGKLYFWRTKSGLEVDFIIYGEIGFWAIEVKLTTNLNNKDFRGLEEFKNDYPESKLIMLYGGKNKVMHKNILCVPVENFLLQILPSQPLS